MTNLVEIVDRCDCARSTVQGVEAILRGLVSEWPSRDDMVVGHAVLVKALEQAAYDLCAVSQAVNDIQEQSET